ncbi:hypothetical protein ACVWWO_001437 [Bradyrhizobium sp. F1.13.1]
MLPSMLRSINRAFVDFDVVPVPEVMDDVSVKLKHGVMIDPEQNVSTLYVPDERFKLGINSHNIGNPNDADNQQCCYGREL